MKDAGFSVTEAELLARIGYLEGWGTTSAETAAVLIELHPQLGYLGGAVDPASASILLSGDPWIASLKTDRGTVHAVIVDRLEEGVVHVRDPWGLLGPGSTTGTQAIILLKDFMEH